MNFEARRRGALSETEATTVVLGRVVQDDSVGGREVCVLVDQDARRFEIPAFQARITKPYTIIELVCGIPGQLLKASPEDPAVKGSLEVRVVGRELTQIRFSPSGTPVGGFSRMTVAVLSIQELLTSGMDIEAIFATVEAGIDLESGETAASLRFHEATGILFVKGSPAVNRTVTETIKALTTSAKWLVSDEALAAKKARIQSEAMSITEEAVKMEGAKLEELKKTQEDLLQKDRERRERRDAERRNAVKSKDTD